MLVDTHAHISAPEFDKDREAAMDRAVSAGVGALINVGYNLDSCRKSVESATRQGIYAAVGVHPHDARNHHKWRTEIEAMIDAPGVVAIGEIGLDYYRNLSEPKEQRECFMHWIHVARKARLPILVHDRDAHQDILDILRLERAGEIGGVLHCFSGDWEMAKACLNMGFHIALGGPVTFKSAQKTHAVAAQVPADRLLLETDCPYLAPEPYRGMRNEPGMVRIVAERIAALRSEPVADVIAATGDNAVRLFGIVKGKTLKTANS